VAYDVEDARIGVLSPARRDVRMGSLWSSLSTGARFGIPAAAICAIVLARIPARFQRISDGIGGAEDEADFEPHLYSEYPFPFGRTADLRTSSRRGSI